MNKHNIKVWKEYGDLVAEWCDRAIDDDDRYTDDSIILVARVPEEGGEKALWSEMANVYDRWYDETRG